MERACPVKWLLMNENTFGVAVSEIAPEDCSEDSILSKWLPEKVRVFSVITEPV